MKTLISYIFILSILFISSISCSNQEIYDTSCTKGNLITFNVLKPSPLTYSNELDKDYYENNIENVYAIAFDKNKNTFSKLYEVYKTNSKDENTNQYTFSLENSGDYKFIFIANPNKDLKVKLNDLSTETNISLNDIENILVNQLPDGKTTTNSLADHFLMTTTPTTDIIVKKNTTNSLGTLSFKHLSAKFKLFNNIEGLVISKITFNKRANKSYFTDFKNTLDNNSYSNYPVTIKNGSDNSIATFYSYEIEKEIDKGIIIEGTYTKNNSIKDIRYTIDLKDYTIKRNNIYNITLKEKPDKINITYDLSIKSWEMGETIQFNNYFTQPDFTIFDVNKNTYVRKDTSKVNKDIEEILNPDSAIITVSDPTELIITIYSKSTESLLECKDILPQGCKIIDNNNFKYNPIMKISTQTFSIHLTENLYHTRHINFTVYNKFDLEKFRDFTIIQKGQNKQIILPIETMCKYNIGYPGYLAASNHMTRSGYYTLKDIYKNSHTGKMHDGYNDTKIVPYTDNNNYDNNTQYDIIPKEYHLPTLGEWKSVLPFFYFSSNDTKTYSLGNIFSIFREDTRTFLDIKSDVTIPNENGTELINTQEISDYKTTFEKVPRVDFGNAMINTSITYALRYKNIDGYKCAYRYDIVRQYWTYTDHTHDISSFTTAHFSLIDLHDSGIGSYSNFTKTESEKCLRISVIRISDENYSIDDIAKDSFWKNHENEIISRILPTTGFVKKVRHNFYSSYYFWERVNDLSWDFPYADNNNDNEAGIALVSKSNYSTYYNKYYTELRNFGFSQTDEFPIRPFKNINTIK